MLLLLHNLTLKNLSQMEYDRIDEKIRAAISILEGAALDVIDRLVNDKDLLYGTLIAVYIPIKI